MPMHDEKFDEGVPMLDSVRGNILSAAPNQPVGIISRTVDTNLIHSAGLENVSRFSAL